MASWTLAMMAKYWPLMSVASIVRLRAFLLAERRGRVSFDSRCKLSLVRPFRAQVVLRPASNDIYTLHEIATEEIYASVCRACLDPQTIVDLGANIGLASLYFAERFRSARIIAVEPFAPNVELLRQNLSALCASGRCTIVEKAIWSSSSVVEAAPLQSTGHVNQVRMKSAVGS